jgi:hypothetical protein
MTDRGNYGIFNSEGNMTPVVLKTWFENITEALFFNITEEVLKRGKQ